ncbi:MAG: bactofilin family protein [Chloroflexota bacterium]
MAENETFINRDTYCRGSLDCGDAVTIDGSFEGDIKTRSSLSVGASARIKGEVEAQAIAVMGEIHGTVTAQELEIRPGGRLFGELRTGGLMVSPGGLFHGKSLMGEEPEDLPAT